MNLFFLQSLFAITPLNWTEWKAVLYISFPVIIIDEVLKFVSVSRDTFISHIPPNNSLSNLLRPRSSRHLQKSRPIKV